MREPWDDRVFRWLVHAIVLFGLAGFVSVLLVLIYRFFTHAMEGP